MTRQLDRVTGSVGKTDLTIRHMAARLKARVMSARVISDRGAATAEYAVVSVAAAGLGGILIKLLTSDWFQEILKTILNWIVKIVLNFFGFGG